MPIENFSRFCSVQVMWRNNYKITWSIRPNLKLPALNEALLINVVLLFRLILLL